MSESLYDGVRWRHVLAPKDGVGQIGFENKITGEIIRINLDVECMRSLVGGIIDYVDPIPADLKECLDRINPSQMNG